MKKQTKQPAAPKPPKANPISFEHENYKRDVAPGIEGLLEDFAGWVDEQVWQLEQQGGINHLFSKRMYAGVKVALAKAKEELVKVGTLDELRRRAGHRSTKAPFAPTPLLPGQKPAAEGAEAS